MVFQRSVSTSAKFGVAVLKASMLDWRRGASAMGICALCSIYYMKLIWCNGFPEIYGQLEEGSGVNLP